ncbi:S-adenosyl-L-methionine-dependent methyltransferase [Coprinellus micaceus]|uniref:S-adenosyl-L-methionine-dependent methyltransferase n=1 Tax=Coprinellus micaceus TaxID=71717 RepID=A0A4Y7TQW3_COPMI|nr:S-adenosyl-L-methionine-dependent methyltransferase [Coprinellus micaceus]
MSTVHKIAQAGFGAGTNDLYDRIRPRYQPWGLKHIKESLASDGPYNVVEIGAGTGIFTRALLADPEWSPSIKELRAVEPSEGMRSVFSKSVNDERVKVSDGTFDTTGVEDGWADLVVIAQAFHWCPDHQRAAKEFERILKPNGAVAMIWNLEDRDAERWAAQVRDLIEQHEHGTPQFRLELWRAYFKTPQYEDGFGAPNEKTWSYHLEADEDIVVDRASSKSYISVLPPDEKARVQAGDSGEIVQRRVTTCSGVDKERGLFKYPYKTWGCYLGRRSRPSFGIRTQTFDAGRVTVQHQNRFHECDVMSPVTK